MKLLRARRMSLTWQQVAVLVIFMIRRFSMIRSKLIWRNNWRLYLYPRSTSCLSFQVLPHFGWRECLISVQALRSQGSGEMGKAPTLHVACMHGLVTIEYSNNCHMKKEEADRMLAHSFMTNLFKTIVMPGYWVWQLEKWPLMHYNALWIPQSFHNLELHQSGQLVSRQPVSG